MTSAHATANLSQIRRAETSAGGLFGLVLRIEAWFDRRATRRALYRLDDRALADIGLTRADLGRPDPSTSWHSLITPSELR
jgi:uncharacterized protein YjiS (DUF1127 family)